MIEDGEDPDAPLDGYKLVMPRGLGGPTERTAAIMRLKACGYTDEQIADLELRAAAPDLTTPRESARNILEKHRLAFPENPKPIPPEAFYELDHDLDDDK